MPTAGEKMWNTQYMDAFNKKRTVPRRTKGVPTVPGRYNNPHPRKVRLVYLQNFLDPPNQTPYAPSCYLTQEEEVAFKDYYADLFQQTANPLVLPWNQYNQNYNLTESLYKENNCVNKKPTVRFDQTEEAIKDNAEENDGNNDKEQPADLPDRVPTPSEDYRTKTQPPDLHWICWPEPEDYRQEKQQRPHTVLGIHRAATPYGASGDDIEDRPNSTEPSYVFGANEESTRGPPLTFVPELQSWVNATTDYDREAAQQIMAMNGTLAPPLPPHALRPQRQATFTFGSNKSRSPSFQPNLDPRNHYSMTWRPFNGSMSHRPMSEEKKIKEMDRRMIVSESLPQIPRLQRSNTDIRPMQRRQIRYPRGEEYVHEHSMFMTTQPLVRGHFIIHPDWVSERLTKKRINLAIPSIRNEFRYGTTYSSEY
ncbi:hypothetical protein FSP39_014281 [Pinctada imbricata]|uniref:Uncharacterized protein n=1 Tax=Pinctada imbricata TaxID=66713 RepID=A0AA88Y596_PINIB|nr:hypothetical protein FSP39_014281 [Pinctada imbricata]